MLPVPVTLTTRFIACLIISSRGSLLTFTRHCYWEGEHPNMYMYIFYTYTYTRNTYMQNIYIQSSTYCFCFQKNNARNISHWEPSWFGGTHQGLKCGGKVDLQTHEWWLNCEPHQLVISRLKAWKDKANCQSIREVTMGMSNYTKQFWTKSPPLADIPLILKYSKTASALWPVHSRKATTWTARPTNAQLPRFDTGGVCYANTKPRTCATHRCHVLEATRHSNERALPGKKRHKMNRFGMPVGQKLSEAVEIEWNKKHCHLWAIIYTNL